MIDVYQLATDIRQWASELGFAQTGIVQPQLGADHQHLLDWLAQGQHGSMGYMARNTELRANPEQLVAGSSSMQSCRAICVRKDYGTDDADAWRTLADGERAYVARYALGRDYHKLMRRRLQQLSDRIGSAIGSFGYRVFVDSAPVLERALARDAGLGWIGKHSCLIDRHNGSWFFLGEILTDLPLPVDAPASAHCGTCTRCIDICPTGAIVAPYRVDARRCISYLTIEHHGSIDETLRPLIGNRIFGCDDCQLVCPWNKFAKRHDEPDFRVRNDLDKASLADLFAWTEAEFLTRTEGSAIRRTGYQNWLRNIAVALGNAPSSVAVIAALHARLEHPSEIVREHVAWALAQHTTSFV
ncbi:MAG: tRNA epoxyqueuosine(34) reductase QueG [Gammaproteobacteria bacterium HGW-Gammaproteobacteria-5]|nr:MAG: tRNA epoxyqueuosine(34) reductase QueG [Gammaproteobacteria bacterium HGW-Gammaproteobacteria-5]